MSARADLTQHALAYWHLHPMDAHLSEESALKAAHDLHLRRSDPNRGVHPPSRTHAALRHRGRARVEGIEIDHYEEAPWACACGARLATHHDEVPEAWARHAHELTGLDPERLREHMFGQVTGGSNGRPVTQCRCGHAAESASALPDLKAWADHARKVAG